MLINISTMLKSSDQKSSKFFECESCDYKTSRKSQYDRHLITAKHQNQQKSTFCQQISTQNVQESSKFICDCGKTYKERSGLWRHKKICDPNIQKNTVVSNEISDKDLIVMLLNDNKELRNMMMEVIKNGTQCTTNNTINHTNSHNKSFNLNFFLNETCKNAMNITDFVDSIKLQLSDLIDVGNLGYVEGISKIIVKNLNNLDETIRPIHCTDKKRETFYVKDAGQWEKEDENQKKIKKVIKNVANKNIKLLPQFREKYPEYSNPLSKVSDKYDKMVIEVMETDPDKDEKIIKNISKVTTIKEKVA